MSVQTLSDIIVNQQVKPSDLQLSGQNQISLNKSESSVSFADLVSFYKDEPKSELKVESPATEQTQSPKASDEKVETSDNAKSSKTEETEKSQKTENQKETKETKAEDDKAEKVEDLKENKKSEKTSAKDEKGKASKENLENLSRINEIAGNVVAVTATENANESNAELKIKKDGELKIDTDGKNVQPEELMLKMAENNLQLNQMENQNSDFDAEEFTKNFDFDQKKSQKSLDKDGKITVEDLRTKEEISKEKLTQNEPKLKTELKIDNENTATITMDYVQNVESDVLSLNNQTAAGNGSTYQQMLNNQVQMNVPEFVKAGNIVLKDNNQGTINLVLHPDDLGNVKIHLTLDGKTVSGHITVASEEALQVFKENAETLREAFIKSGFDAANFDVAYGGNNNNFGENADFQRNDGTELFGRKMYGTVASSGEDFLDDFSQINENSENFSINIVA